MKTICVFGDRHGHDFKVDPDEYNYVVFTGNYLDSHAIDWKKQFTNLHKIIRLKKDYSNVILLIGNHDYQYFNPTPNYRCPEFQIERFHAYNATFRDYWDLFQYTFQVGNWLFSHAGISKTFLDSIRFRTGMFYDTRDFSTEFNSCADSFVETFFHSTMNGGHDPFDGPLWIKPEQLLNDLPDEKLFQVVGHTHINYIAKNFLNQNIVKFCNNESYGNSFHEFKIL